MKIEGKRIILRLPLEEDIEDILKWENDTEVWAVSDNRGEFTRRDIEAFVNSRHDLEREKQMRLMICDASDQRRLGCIDLFEYDAFHLRAGVGILIYEKTDRQKGMGKESLSLLIEYCRLTLKMKQLYCNILENNSASISLFNSCGFSKVGNKLQWRKVGEEWMNELLLQRLLN